MSLKWKCKPNGDFAWRLHPVELGVCSKTELRAVVISQREARLNDSLGLVDVFAHLDAIFCTVFRECSWSVMHEFSSVSSICHNFSETWRKPIARVWEMRWLMGGRSALKRTGRGIGCTEIIRNVHERLSWGNSQTSWQIVEIACCGNWIVLNFDQFWNFARFYNFRNAWNWTALEIQKSWRFRSSTLCCVVNHKFRWNRTLFPVKIADVEFLKRFFVLLIRNWTLSSAKIAHFEFLKFL